MFLLASPLLIFIPYLTWRLFLSFAFQKEQDPKASSFTQQFRQNQPEFCQNHFKKKITNYFLDRASNFLSELLLHIGTFTNAVYQAAMQHLSLSLDGPDSSSSSNWV